MLKVLFFASFREQLNCDQLLLDDGEYPTTVFSLKQQLANKSERWRAVMMSEHTLVAVNKTVIRKDAELHSGDEVAFFPPVTGG